MTDNDTFRVEILNGQSDPEELVCRAARNDYRAHGVMPDEYDFRDVMKGIDPADEHLEYNSGARRSPSDSRKRTLIDHLIRSGHWGPFEHPQAILHLKGVTRVLMAQLTRHRHASFDIMSMRYVDFEDTDFSDDEVLEERFQIPKCVKEGQYIGRGGDKGIVEIDDRAEEVMKRIYRQQLEGYRELLDLGLPTEEARKVLGMGTKVNIVVSANARAWMHMLSVRQKPDVQGETKRCADAIAEKLETWMPYTFRRFEEKQPMELAP